MTDHSTHQASVDTTGTTALRAIQAERLVAQAERLATQDDATTRQET